VPLGEKLLLAKRKFTHHPSPGETEADDDDQNSFPPPVAQLQVRTVQPEVQFVLKADETVGTFW
jgi:hypothetical protein